MSWGFIQILTRMARVMRRLRTLNIAGGRVLALRDHGDVSIMVVASALKDVAEAFMRLAGVFKGMALLIKVVAGRFMTVAGLINHKAGPINGVAKAFMSVAGVIRGVAIVIKGVAGVIKAVAIHFMAVADAGFPGKPNMRYSSAVQPLQMPVSCANMPD